MSKPYASQPNNKPIFNEFITQIGVIVHLYHDKPQLKTKDQHGQVPDIDPETGIQRAEFKATMMWPKTDQQKYADVAALAHKTKGEAWPESLTPGAFFALEPFFRDGDNPQHNTKNKEYLRGMYYLNFKQKAQAAYFLPATGQEVPRGTPGAIVKYSGAPGLIGPNKENLMPVDIFPGCEARVSGVMFGTEYMGKHFISTRLNNIQLFRQGERIGGGGGRPDAADQFDALPGGQSIGGVAGGGMSGLAGLL